jgi:hypothetical protein
MSDARQTAIGVAGAVRLDEAGLLLAMNSGFSSAHDYNGRLADRPVRKSVHSSR